MVHFKSVIEVAFQSVFFTLERIKIMFFFNFLKFIFDISTLKQSKNTQNKFKSMIELQCQTRSNLRDLIEFQDSMFLPQIQVN
jgi:hypothetical protein